MCEGSCLIGEFSVSIQVADPGGVMWWFTCIYGPNNTSYRYYFWDKVARLSSVCGDFWCLGGDFNVFRFVHKKFNGSTIVRSMRLFNDLIGE